MRRRNITYLHCRRTVTLATILTLFLFAPGRVVASAPDIAALCDDAAFTAAQAEDVPYDILRAITRTETGRTVDGVFRPWPWAANAAGQGDWFDSAEAALRHVEGILASGRRNVDVGCFQLNHRWHADGFTSLRVMMDPEANARYAAQFLSQLYGEFGDWDAAVAAYHSRTPAYAARYMARFRDIRAALPDATPPPNTPPGRPRITGPSPLDFSARPTLANQGLGLALQRAAPLLSNIAARPLFGDRP
ncbi:MAG TPA: lytic transglycosylase domain-containing protein [Roseibacterium sp.]|nr:lytic transglycosylase domain-containing protein [Roseibacterium sp.]